MNTETALRNAQIRIPVLADAATGEFFAGAARHAFLLPRRTSTGEYLAPQGSHDPDDADLAWVPASGRGTVVSWTTVYGRDAGRNIVPERTLGIVQLDEGPWWWTELLTADAEPRDLIGRTATVRFIKSGEGETHEFVPVFAVS